MTDKVQKIKEWIQTRKLCTMDEHMKFYCKEAESDYNLLCSIEKILDSLQEEPVSEVLLDTTQTITYKGEVYTRCYKDKLDAFACKYPMSVPKSSKRYAKYSDVDLTIAVKEGANWRKQQMINKGAEWLRKCLDNGMWVDQFLSEKDKEAIVLTYKENMEEEFKL